MTENFQTINVNQLKGSVISSTASGTPVKIVTVGPDAALQQSKRQSGIQQQIVYQNAPISGGSGVLVPVQQVVQHVQVSGTSPAQTVTVIKVMPPLQHMVAPATPIKSIVIPASKASTGEVTATQAGGFIVNNSQASVVPDKPVSLASNTSDHVHAADQLVYISQGDLELQAVLQKETEHDKQGQTATTTQISDLENLISQTTANTTNSTQTSQAAAPEPTVYCVSCNENYPSSTGCCLHKTCYSIVPDSPVLSRARQSVPPPMTLRSGTRKDNTTTVWSKEHIEKGTRFGPVVGVTSDTKGESSGDGIDKASTWQECGRLSPDPKIEVTVTRASASAAIPATSSDDEQQNDEEGDSDKETPEETGSGSKRHVGPVKIEYLTDAKRRTHAFFSRKKGLFTKAAKMCQLLQVHVDLSISYLTKTYSLDSLKDNVARIKVHWVNQMGETKSKSYSMNIVNAECITKLKYKKQAFCKRRQNLFNKATEIEVLTGAEVQLTITNMEKKRKWVRDAEGHVQVTAIPAAADAGSQTGTEAEDEDDVPDASLQKPERAEKQSNTGHSTIAAGKAGDQPSAQTGKSIIQTRSQANRAKAKQNQAACRVTEAALATPAQEVGDSDVGTDMLVYASVTDATPEEIIEASRSVPVSTNTMSKDSNSLMFSSLVEAIPEQTADAAIPVGTNRVARDVVDVGVGSDGVDSEAETSQPATSTEARQKRHHRGKIVIQYVKDIKYRKDKFLKRRQGLFRKASELRRLTAVEVSLKVTDVDRNIMYVLEEETIAPPELPDEPVTVKRKSHHSGPRSIKYIQCPKNRYDCFMKRQKGLFTKALELRILTGAEIELTVINREKKVQYQYLGQGNEVTKTKLADTGTGQNQEESSTGDGCGEGNDSDWDEDGEAAENLGAICDPLTQAAEVWVPYSGNQWNGPSSSLQTNQSPAESRQQQSASSQKRRSDFSTIETSDLLPGTSMDSPSPNKRSKTNAASDVTNTNSQKDKTKTNPQRPVAKVSWCPLCYSPGNSSHLRLRCDAQRCQYWVHARCLGLVVPNEDADRLKDSHIDFYCPFHIRGVP